MKNLLNFLVKYNYCLLFFFFEAISFILLIQLNHYQQSVFFTSANSVVGSAYKLESEVTSYFYLKTANQELLDRNINLEQQLANLRAEMHKMNVDSLGIDSIMARPLWGKNLIRASVIGNSLDKVDNYITLDKGTNSGIRSEMGVIDRNGVVGIVYLATRNYSIVISLLNKNCKVSCKIAKNGYFGTLKWEGGDARYAYLDELPRHARFSLGDTVVTSGYSDMFPAGLMVGTVDHIGNSRDGLSFKLKIRLATDFGRLSDVRIIPRVDRSESSLLKEAAAKQSTD